jgi:hypothetical protein
MATETTPGHLHCLPRSFLHLLECIEQRNSLTAESNPITPLTMKDLEDMEAHGLIREIVDGQWVRIEEERMLVPLGGGGLGTCLQIQLQVTIAGCCAYTSRS